MDNTTFVYTALLVRDVDMAFRRNELAERVIRKAAADTEIVPVFEAENPGDVIVRLLETHTASVNVNVRLAGVLGFAGKGRAVVFFTRPRDYYPTYSDVSLRAPRVLCAAVEAPTAYDPEFFFTEVFH